jgi:hypothetical protein
LATPSRSTRARTQSGNSGAADGESVLGGTDGISRTSARERWWYANCAWDAFGICAALHTGGRIETSCPDCGEPFGVTVCDERPDDEGLLFHCLVPAAHWWDDIVFT